MKTADMSLGCLVHAAGWAPRQWLSNLAAGLQSRTKAEVILAEMLPGQGTLALDVGVDEFQRAGGPAEHQQAQ